MTPKRAMAFLAKHQPMSSEDSGDPNTMRLYDQVRRFVESNPNPDIIPLLLNSFAPTNGLGVFQLMPWVLRKFAPDLVIPHLIRALRSTHPGVRYWCTEIAADFPSLELVGPLAERLGDQDPDVREAAAVALSQIPDDTARDQLLQRYQVETDPDVRIAIRELLGS